MGSSIEPYQHAFGRLPQTVNMVPPVRVAASSKLQFGTQLEEPASTGYKSVPGESLSGPILQGSVEYMGSSIEPYQHAFGRLPQTVNKCGSRMAVLSPTQPSYLRMAELATAQP